MKKILWSTFICMILGMMVSCGKDTGKKDGAQGSSEKEKKKIILAVRADGIDMAESIREDVKKAGYELEIKTFDDSIQPNVALGEKSVDVNWFQHIPYLENYNKSNGTDFVMAEPYTHYPLFAMYSNKHTKISDIPDGATIGLCNDASNMARGLKMLRDYGLIEIKDGVTSPTLFDISKNPKGLKFIEAEMSVLPQALGDVDAIVLAGMHMKNAGLDASKYVEKSKDGPEYSLGFVVRKEDKDAKWLKDLNAVAKSESLKKYFISTGGTLIPEF